MKRVCSAVLAFAVVLSAALAVAQGRMPAWNPGTVETFKGTVAGEMDLGRFNMHVIAVKTDGGNRPVVLGPKQMIDPALAALAPPAEVEVTASKVKGPERELYLASVVKAGGKEYRLRDEQGHLLGKDGKPLPGRR
jgi:hypothetical protein